MKKILLFSFLIIQIAINSMEILQKTITKNKNKKLSIDIQYNPELNTINAILIESCRISTTVIKNLNTNTFSEEAIFSTPRYSSHQIEIQTQQFHITPQPRSVTLLKKKIDKFEKNNKLSKK